MVMVVGSKITYIISKIDGKSKYVHRISKEKEGKMWNVIYEIFSKIHIFNQHIFKMNLNGLQKDCYIQFNDIPRNSPVFGLINIPHNPSCSMHPRLWICWDVRKEISWMKWDLKKKSIKNDQVTIK